MASEWSAYFDRLTSGSPLHRLQSKLYVEALVTEVGVRPEDKVFDFGCGFGFVAALLASQAGEVCWWDPSPNMRAAAEHTTAGMANTRRCDPPAVDNFAPQRGMEGSFDLILVNSVAQYMPPEEFSAWLHRWRRMLVPTGRAVLSDLIPPGHRGWSDVADLVLLGASHGLPLRAARDALGGLGRYWRTSRAAPLVSIGVEDLERRALHAGLEVQVLPRNLTHFRKRWTALLHVS